MSHQVMKDAEKSAGWYRYGVIFLYLEMFIAIAVSVYSLYMAFTGKGGFPGKH